MAIVDDDANGRLGIGSVAAQSRVAVDGAQLAGANPIVAKGRWRNSDFVNDTFTPSVLFTAASAICLSTGAVLRRSTLVVRRL